MSEQEQNTKFHRYFHNFLIYFALWAYALVAVISGIREIIFGEENNVEGAVIIYILGGILIAIGLFTIKVRFDLAAFRPKAPEELLGVCLAAAADILLLYLWYDYTGADDNRKRLLYVVVLVCWGISLYRYYKQRPYLFGKK